MVGPISDDFKLYIDEFFEKNPELKDYITFTGNVEDRDELYRIYAESKIFCLPSRYGSFEIVFPEALYYGNYLLITDIGVGSYLNEISDFVSLVEIDDVDDISNKLIQVIENYDELYEKSNTDFKKLVRDEFSYKSYIKLLNDRLTK